MKICPGCGANMPDVAAFCGKCGLHINQDTGSDFSDAPSKRSWMAPPAEDELSSWETMPKESLKMGEVFKTPAENDGENPYKHNKTHTELDDLEKAEDTCLFNDAESTATYTEEMLLKHTVDVPLCWEKTIDTDDVSDDFYLNPPAIKNRMRLLFALIVCVAFIVYVGVYYVADRTGPGKVVDILENAINGDGYKMKAIVDPYCLADEGDTEAERISDIYIQRARALYDVNNNSYVNLELLSYSEVDTDKLNRLRSIYSKKNLHIEEAYNCRVKITIDSKGKTYDMNDLDCIVKINGSWYPCMIDDRQEWAQFYK